MLQNALIMFSFANFSKRWKSMENLFLLTRFFVFSETWALSDIMRTARIAIISKNLVVYQVINFEFPNDFSCRRIFLIFITLMDFCRGGCKIGSKVEGKFVNFCGLFKSQVVRILALKYPLLLPITICYTLQGFHQFSNPSPQNFSKTRKGSPRIPPRHTIPNEFRDFISIWISFKVEFPPTFCHS